MHVRSCYSLLKSTLRIEDIVELAKSNGFTSIALSDFGVMHGAMAFYHACIKHNIKPLFAIELNVLINDERFGFIILAKNDNGYQDLLRLSTHLQNESNAPITLDEFTEYAHDCVVVLSGDQDAFETYLIKEESAKIITFLQTCANRFITFFVGINRNDSGLFKQKNIYLKTILNDLQLEGVACSRIYYGSEQDQEAYQVLCAISQQVSVNDKTLNVGLQRYFRSEKEMLELYDLQDWNNTQVISDMCNVVLKFEHAKLPKFSNKLNIDSESYLRKLCFKGLEKRMSNNPISNEYGNRLTYELDVINKMGYADYFLIVWDFIRFAKSQEIYIGPGRGSAAGSLVAYCLGITHVDPIKYELLFERFLNPQRISMPDIDTDFPDNRREEVIEYVKERYGNNHAANIITFNTLAAKQVIRDVGKALLIPPRNLDLLSKLIPKNIRVELLKVYQQVPNFKKMVDGSSDLKHLFNIALKLEGLPRHASLHAAGIVLSNKEISNVCPLIQLDQQVSTTQFTMEYLEELGLIKMDFLGLRNLTIIDDIVQAIKQKDSSFDIMAIPLDDSNTFKLIQSVDTMGVFQLESEGMKNLVRQMKPNCFEDIVATIALFRPGPMENIPAFLKNRNQPQNVDYIHKNLEPILKKTFGVIVYQEQIMQIAQVMADFTLGEADILRKAMSKKHISELQQYQSAFIDGAIKKGYTNEIARKVYDYILKFANYGFNRSHSVAYGMIAYQLAYLKANEPLLFYISLLNSVISAPSKTSEYIFDAKKRKIVVGVPCVQSSTLEYEVEENNLRYPLVGIKGVGISVCNSLLNERSTGGKFIDFFDFVARMNRCSISKKQIESLIYAGACDCFKHERMSLIASLDDAFRYADLVKIDDESQVILDFDLVSKPTINIQKSNRMFLATMEYESLGFYLSEHPMAQLRERIDASLSPLAIIQKQKGYVKFIAHVVKTRQHQTKNGELMMFVEVNDDTSNFDLAVMPNIYAANSEILVKGNNFLIEGRIDKLNSCLVKKIQLIKDGKIVY